MVRYFLRIFDRIVCLTFMLLFCQLPLFMNEYVLILRGHLAETKLIYKEIEAHILETQQTISEYLDNLKKYENVDMQKQGILIQNIYNRKQIYEQAVESIESTTPFLRPFVFIRYMQPSIVTETWHAYHFGLAGTRETIIWAIFGLIMGSIFSWSIKLFIRTIRSKVFAKDENNIQVAPQKHIQISHGKHS